ncbi:hypothetical protein DFH06DRAFT_284298 [Mycena polygramma]|nr:hypothetical protein DFH06DRAFT_284298 [Mycena polygramma]
MFSNSSGFQFIGNVCNAERGDIILQNSDLVVRGPDEAFGQPVLSASTLESIPGAGTHGYLGPAGQNCDAPSQFPVNAALGFEREGAGMARHPRRAILMRLLTQVDIHSTTRSAMNPRLRVRMRCMASLHLSKRLSQVTRSRSPSSPLTPSPTITCSIDNRILAPPSMR